MSRRRRGGRPARSARAHRESLPPGTAVYTGETLTRDVTVHAIDYDETTFDQQDCTTVEDCARFRDSAQPTWIRVDGVHRVEVVEALGQLFQLHPLVVEDIVNVQQRPKLEDYGTYLFASLRIVHFDQQSDRLRFQQVSLVLMDRHLLSFQQDEEPLFDELLHAIEAGRAKIRSKGPDYLAYRLIDIVVDHYFEVLEQLGDRVEEIEDDLVARPDSALLPSIQRLKRDVMSLRRAIWPLREVVSQLDRLETGLVSDDTHLYLRDLYDHAVQAMDMVETALELISGMHDLYLSGVSNRMNEVMKVLAVISTMFLPMNFLAGVYGMNFEVMPGLHNPRGFWLCAAAMALCSLSALAWFRRKGWV